MRFQLGDVRVHINDKPYTLRLTLSALAQISDCLYAPSPQSLSTALRSLTSEQARALLSCLACPHLPETDSSAGAIADTEIKRLLPDICRVFETTFSN